MGRLLILALLTQLPYPLAFEKMELNAIFCLLFGLVAIYVLDHVEQFKMGWLTAIGLLTFVIPVDYGIYGVSLIILYHTMKGYRAIQVHLLLNVVFFVLSGSFTQLFSVLATILLVKSPPWTQFHLKEGFRWIYRIFYPAHLLLLFAIKWFIDRI